MAAAMSILFLVVKTRCQENPLVYDKLAIETDLYINNNNNHYKASLS